MQFQEIVVTWKGIKSKDRIFAQWDILMCILYFMALLDFFLLLSSAIIQVLMKFVLLLHFYE